MVSIMGAESIQVSWVLSRVGLYSDISCYLVGGDQQSSAVIKNNNNPVWDEVFYVSICILIEQVCLL